VLRDFGSWFFADPNVPFDYQVLAQGHTKVFYYDCLPERRKNETEDELKTRTDAQEKLFKRLRSLPGWHVLQGVAKRTRKSGVTQKEVDVMIAVDMLTHTYRRNMSALTFVAGDQDFLPLVEALVREGMYVKLLYEKESASQELINSSDERKALDIYALHGLLSFQFRHAHPLPAIQSRPSESMKDQQLVSTLNLPDDAAIEIRRSSTVANSYVAMILIPGHAQSRAYEFDDLSFLKKVCKDCHNSDAEWNDL
jgi:uncharacterized LabA/DUF88 family protein